MGRLSIARMLVGSLLVGSAALAQQGLIIEPWRRAPSSGPVPAPAARVMPASGLPQLLPPAPAARTEPATLAAQPPAERWSPPVVELLVDPWAKARAAAPLPRPRWDPRTLEIIDPWADEAPAPPRVAAATSTGRSTIF